MTQEASTPKHETNGAGTFIESRPNLPLELGEIVMTSGAKTLSPVEVAFAVAAHRSGNWGKVCVIDHDANNHALAHGGRIVSVYTASDGRDFWIITDCIRTWTTVLLPSEY